MKINKDLVDAIMMVSLIILVLIGTTDFDSAVTKNVTMGALGLLSIVMIVLRIVYARQVAKESREYGY